MRVIGTVAALLAVLAVSAYAGVITFGGSWGEHGFNMVSETPEGMEIVYSLHEIGVEELVVDGETMHQVAVSGIFLPNDEGAPNLPGTGRFIAIPQESSARVRILASRTEVFHDVNLAPAPPIPLDTDDSPPVYEKDPAIYDVNAYYPAEPVKLSEPMQMRGVDCVILGITPFQYNPVTRELVVYKDLRVSVDFVGGNGHFGEDRLRSRFWEPILQGHLVNYFSLPEVDYYDAPRDRDGGYEYIIIVPDDPVFIAWGDTVKAWRKLQGITSEVFTTTQLGGNTVQAIESFIDSAYANWDPAPVAFLLLSDFQSSGETYGITSPMWNNYCRSDNMFADVNNDNLPDLCHARICAQNETHLSTMINKFLSYEREPYTDPGYYDHPLIACGWQTERWFQFCTEVVFGYFVNEQGKDPVHQYNVYIGNPSPGCAWSTNQNTYMVVNYFGESGLGYVPDTNPHTYQYWNNGSAAGINAAIEAGAFILQHRDHGSETGWGEPDYDIYDVQQLTNDMYTFVFTINCLTGMYDWYNECFTEAFHRSEHGALGLIAASDVSYSFVNDTYVWGYYDLMWPDFMPDYPVYPSPPLYPYTNLMPGFGNVSGKYFLQQSSWPYNTSNKNHTYHLFHMHGDAFTTLYSEVPQDLTVIHDPTIIAGQNFFVVTADDGSLIALTVDGEIIGVAEGTGAPVTISIPPQVPPTVVHVTVTKFNYFRYESDVMVIAPSGPYVVYHDHQIDDTVGGNGNGMVEIGESIEMPLAVKNVGVDQAFGVYGELSTGDQYVTITDNYESFGDILPDQVVWSPDDYDFDVAGDAPDGHQVAFVLDVTDASRTTWTSNFSVTIHAPVLAYEDHLIDDSGGNGNGIADPGETVDLTVTINNSGSAAASGIWADLSTTDPLLTIVTGGASYPDLGAGESGSSVTPYVFSVDPNHAVGQLATFVLDITTSGPYAKSDTFQILIGREPALIWEADPTPISGDAQAQALLEHGITAVITNDLFAHGDINAFQAIFVDLGIYSSNHVIQANSPEALALEAYVEGGGNLYMEGGDVWYYDPMVGGHQFCPLFGINATSDGSGDLYSVTGQANTLMPDIGGMSFSYSGGNSWIDHIMPISPAELIFRNTSNTDPIGVAKEQTYGGATIGTSFEFGGLVDGQYTKSELMAAIIEFFDLMPSLPDVSVELVPDATVYAPGDELGFTATVTNNTQEAQSFYAIGEVYLPNSNPYSGNPVFGPTHVTLDPGASASRHITHMIPYSAPGGTYTYAGTVGLPPDIVIDSDSFEFDVIP